MLEKLIGGILKTPKVVFIDVDGTLLYCERETSVVQIPSFPFAATDSSTGIGFYARAWYS